MCDTRTNSRGAAEVQPDLQPGKINPAGRGPGWVVRGAALTEPRIVASGCRPGKGVGSGVWESAARSECSLECTIMRSNAMICAICNIMQKCKKCAWAKTTRIFGQEPQHTLGTGLCVCVWSCSGLCGSMPRSARAHMHVTERACLYYCILSAARYKRERAHPPLPFLPVLEYARRKKYVQGDSTQHGPVPLRGRNFVLLFSATGTALGRCV